MHKSTTKVRVMFAALCILIATLMGAWALTRAQTGPGWEVPATVVSQLTAVQPVAFVLTALGAMLIARSVALDRPSAFPVVLLVVQMLLAVVIVTLATPSIAGQWPVTRPTFSNLARHGLVPIVALSALLGIAGIARWNRNEQG